MDNKRENIRHNAFLSPIGCSKSGCGKTSVDVSDISSDGIGIRVNQRLTKGDKIELEVLIPGDDIPMFVHGEIAWITKDTSSQDLYNAGVRLDKFHKNDRNRLVRYLHSTSPYKD